MELKRWNPVNNELGGCDIKPVCNGNFVLHSDAIAYAEERVKEATRWHDAEKEKPELRKMYFVEVLSSCTMDISNNISLFFDMGWSLEYLNPEFKVIRYIEIPKNEGEE